MKKKIKNLLMQVRMIEEYKHPSIRLYSDDSGMFIGRFNRIIFEFNDLEGLEKGMKKIIKEQTK